MELDKTLSQKVCDATAIGGANILVKSPNPCEYESEGSIGSCEGDVRRRRRRAWEGGEAYADRRGAQKKRAPEGRQAAGRGKEAGIQRAALMKGAGQAPRFGQSWGGPCAPVASPCPGRNFIPAYTDWAGQRLQGPPRLK
jgi:hypothetical protein